MKSGPKTDLECASEHMQRQLILGSFATDS